MIADWLRLGDVVRTADKLTEDAPPPVRSMLDQADASLRDGLEQIYGLRLDDPDVVFTGFAWHGLIFSQLAVSAQLGLIDAHSFNVIGGIFRANAAQLAEHAPAEARK